MWTPSDSNLKRIRIVAFSLLVVLIPFIVYYYFWVTRQTKYYTGRDIRVLAALTRHVEDSIKNQGEVFTNAVEKYLHDLDKTSAKQGEQAGSDKANELEHHREKLKRDFQTIYLDPLKADGTNLTITNVDPVSV